MEVSWEYSNDRAWNVILWLSNAAEILAESAAAAASRHCQGRFGGINFRMCIRASTHNLVEKRGNCYKGNIEISKRTNQFQE